MTQGHEENCECQFTTPWLQIFHHQTVSAHDSTIPAELSKVLRPVILQPEAQSMPNGESMIAPLHISWRRIRERGRKKKGKRNFLEFKVSRLELNRELYNKKSRQAACQELKNWDDNTDPITYLDNFQLVMKEAKISQEEWVNLVRKQLRGKTLSTFQEEALKRDTPYQVFKSTILEWMGATVDKA